MLFRSQYNYPFMLEDKTVKVMAYTIETVLAEKYETIIRRNIGNTRARDFMIYIFSIVSVRTKSGRIF